MVELGLILTPEASTESVPRISLEARSPHKKQNSRTDRTQQTSDTVGKLIKV